MAVVGQRAMPASDTDNEPTLTILKCTVPVCALA